MVALALLFGVTTAANASAKPSVRFSFLHSRINAGGQPVARIAVAHAPRGSRILVQRQMGTAKVWGKVTTLAASSQRARLPKASMSRSAYRMLLVKGGRTLAASRTQTLTAFGTINVTAFCHSFAAGDGSCQHGTHSINGQLWTYNMTLFSSDNEWSTFLRSPRGTSCRSLSVSWVQQQGQPVTGYLRVQQTRTDEEDASGPGRTINNSAFTLDGGPFVFADTNSSQYSSTIYLDGTASCYTADGKL